MGEAASAFVGLLGIGAFLGFILGGFWLLACHRQKMAEIRAAANNRQLKAVEESIESLRKEFGELRETCTRYDLSFDTTLESLESRMARLEARTKSQETVSVQQTASSDS